MAAVDAGTTAYVMGAMIRMGHTPTEGKYQANVRRAAELLCTVVEQCKRPDAMITDVQGTQIQGKLGPLVDTALATDCLARLRHVVGQDDPLAARVDAALDVCLKKLVDSQEADGSWNGRGGWAAVLQSSLACAALELAKTAGKDVNADVLAKARDYHKRLFNVDNRRIDAQAAAGVQLYALAAAQRANAIEGRVADDLVAAGRAGGRLAVDATPTADTLGRLGVEGASAKRIAAASQALAAQHQLLDDKTLLRGYGTIGGEELLSYWKIGESLLIASDKREHPWTVAVSNQLLQAQNPDGSWSGHHCISNQVFCTAAVLHCMTVDADYVLFMQMVGLTADQAMGQARDR